MATKRLKRPRDPVKRAKLIGDIATGQVQDEQPVPRTIEANRRGGIKGAAVRAAKLTPERRAEIAKTAAKARWGAKKAAK